MTNNALKATVIISVYRDKDALRTILDALALQTVNDFFVVVSEDGESQEIASVVANEHRFPELIHLTQEDIGFRKNRALNRAIVAAKSDWLIFIDGDCVPHHKFISAHLTHARKGVVTGGRRVELGEKWSHLLRQNSELLCSMNSYGWWWRHLPSLNRDRTKAIELMLMPPGIGKRMKRRASGLLGCNFAAHRDDLIAINGFDEQYCAPGIGEDSDIDWRLRQYGVHVINVKFTALQWHLHHPRGYTTSEENLRILRHNQEQGILRPLHGIDNHLHTLPHVK